MDQIEIIAENVSSNDGIAQHMRAILDQRGLFGLNLLATRQPDPHGRPSQSVIG